MNIWESFFFTSIIISNFYNYVRKRLKSDLFLITYFFGYSAFDVINALKIFPLKIIILSNLSKS